MFFKVINKIEYTILTAYHPVSIKRPVLNFWQKSLLKVLYDRKNEGLNILSTRSYNRMVRVVIWSFIILIHK